MTTNTIIIEDPKRRQIKAVAKLAGFGAGVYLANKKGLGAWGFVGYGILGLIGGSVVGGMVYDIVSPKTDNK